MSSEVAGRSRVLWVTAPRGPGGGGVEAESARFAVDRCSAGEAMDRVETGRYSAVVADDELADGNGVTVLGDLRERFADLPLVLLVTDDASSEREALRNGVTACHRVADDGVDPATLAARIETLVETYEGGQSVNERAGPSVLSDLNDVIYQVAEAAFRQDSRHDVEAFVCEAFAAADSYRFAWVGNPGEDREEMTVVADANTGSYLDAIDLRLDGPVDEQGPTARAVHTGEVHVVDDTLTDEAFAAWRDRAREHDVRSSAAVPIHDGTQFYGVLNVYSQRPQAFAAREQRALAQLGQLVAHAIAAVERRNRYETLVENLPNGAIALLDSEKRCLTIGGERLQDLDVGADAFEGKPIDEISVIPESVRDWWADVVDDALDGERRVAERESEDGYARVMAIPVSAGETVQGVMALTQDITERKTREQQLEAERERLEFLNRLIRHNLLNGLNVINARCQLLESTVEDPEAREHVSHIRNRGTDLADLVDKMRTLMDAIVGESEHSLRRMPLTETLERKVTLASEMHPDARFHVDVPDRDVRVLGDQLLGEVFENVLDNAVTHNDADTPDVWVSARETRATTFVDPETGEHVPGPDRQPARTGQLEAVECPAVTVEVADNGPGIPPEEREGVLETGVSQLSEPGSGFGLYLVKQMLESYGGDIGIRDNEPRGTVFELTFLTERPDPTDATRTDEDASGTAD